jgi:hypothetical protein
MNIYTYYEVVAGINAQAELIRVWDQSWRRRGWVPRILTKRDAERHPRFREFHDRVNTYPTANNREYENACYYRWLALSQVGGGWMCDYDVINFAFYPQTRTLAFEIPEQAYVPCVAWMKPRTQRPIDLIMEYGPVPKWPANVQAEKNHISDMLIFQNRLQNGLDLGDTDQAVVCEFGEPRWKTLPLIHFSHSVTVGKGYASKVDAIRRCGRNI